MSTLVAGSVAPMERTPHPTGERISGVLSTFPLALTYVVRGHGDFDTFAGLSNVTMRGILHTSFLGLGHATGWFELRRPHGRGRVFEIEATTRNGLFTLPPDGVWKDVTPLPGRRPNLFPRYMQFTFNGDSFQMDRVIFFGD